MTNKYCETYCAEKCSEYDKLLRRHLRRDSPHRPTCGTTKQMVQRKAIDLLSAGAAALFGLQHIPVTKRR
jgi:hypothetical protein